MPGELCILVTCEHGGNRVPAAYRALFAGRDGMLRSHRGWDPGALILGRDLARLLHAPLLSATTTRLLVDLNRSPDHPDLFSRYSRVLDAAARTALLEKHYTPYREAVEARIRQERRRGCRVLHLSAHSFTPRLHGETRHADLGLLYDPRRRQERDFCLALQDCVTRALPGLAVRRNYPYRGTADGLTTWLRRRFPAAGYLGVELELNQRIGRRPPREWRELRAALAHCIRHAGAHITWKLN